MPVDDPAEPLWGPETAKAVENFPVSGEPVPAAIIHWLARIKAAAAVVNAELGLLDDDRARRIVDAAAAVAAGDHDAHFPVDVFQTGSGTSTNMNANEVIARLARQSGVEDIHPNDDVNMGQSSNDVIPTAIHVSAALDVTEKLLPALEHLAQVLGEKAKENAEVVKTGRTHLMDAMPVTLGQELEGWKTQVEHGADRIRA